jgi:protein-tyrosine phosphatase
MRDRIYPAVLDRPDDADTTSCTWLAGGADSATLMDMRAAHSRHPGQEPQPRGRTLRLRGAVNLRDLGDCPTTSGGRTLRGRIYRSGELRELAPTAIAAVKRRGVRGVVDLRTHSELDSSPNPFRHDSTVEYHHAPIFSDEEGYGFGEWPGAGAVYSHWLRARSDGIARALRTVAALPGPLLIGCTLGCDRTGVISAFLLSIAGVPAAVIARDYALSGRHLRHHLAGWIQAAVAAGADPDEASRKVMIQSRHMLSMLSELDDAHGGAHCYLRRAGLEDVEVRRLKALLLAE